MLAGVGDGGEEELLLPPPPPLLDDPEEEDEDGGVEGGLEEFEAPAGDDEDADEELAPTTSAKRGSVCRCRPADEAVETGSCGDDDDEASVPRDGPPCEPQDSLTSTGPEAEPVGGVCDDTWSVLCACCELVPASNDCSILELVGLPSRSSALSRSCARSVPLSLFLLTHRGYCL